ncbi:MAG: hypothetical protein ACI9FY_001623, partial [Patiriisocius sp.]
MFLKFPAVSSPVIENYTERLLKKYPPSWLIYMKEKIIQSAINLFITLGFKSVTMDDIASEIGISKKTIYTHFN